MNTDGMLALDLQTAPGKPTTKWFTARGCVVEDGPLRRVYLGGSLIGEYSQDDHTTRNLLMTCCAEEPRIRRGKLASAFGVSTELLRQLMLQRQKEGLEGVANRRRKGAPRKVTARLRVQIEELFESGMTIKEAHAKLRRSRKKVSQSSVGAVHREWKLRQEQEQPVCAATAEGSEATRVEAQRALRLVQPATDSIEEGTITERRVEHEHQDEEALVIAAEDEIAPADVPDELGIRPVAPMSAQHVQHLGVWLLLAVLKTWDIYDRAQRALAAGSRMRSSTLRIALDALIAALAIGQRCAEGVRRVATPTAGTLLRSSRCPSAPWVRSVAGSAAAKGGAARFHVDVASHFVAEATARGEAAVPVVFYVDNHLRPYTGQRAIRKGWRMQDRRARPGVTDYYVHDESGRPVLRVDVPEHDHLTQWLPPLATLLRDTLGPDERVLVAFDRGGAFAENLTTLRSLGVDFVTYERKPYRRYLRSAFEQSFVCDDERVLVHDTRANLGKGRGRVRRIALLMEDGSQVNLLAVSELPAEDLYRIARGRWRQENGFKHGNERWGQNQLDGRTTEPVPPHWVIPNPARSQLDRAIRIARAREGRLRCDIAQLEPGAPRLAKLEAELERTVRDLEEFEAARPAFPKHAPLAETPLAGKLVRHRGEYKMWIDSVRIACANAEAELAGMLGPLMPRPAEAKKTLANVFSAPGDVGVSPRRISVTLRPAGTAAERKAMTAFLRGVSAMRLSLPGDEQRRPLTFRAQY